MPARSHGMSRTPENNAWRAAKYRCTNPNAKHYADYGGRGISMCDEWTTSFEAFFDHIGPRPSSQHSLDRIDVNGDYEPGNVRWATAHEQNLNRRPAEVCKNGLHAMTPENTVPRPGVIPGRLCRACLQATAAKRLKGRPIPKPCGTDAAYQRHIYHGEKPCPECVAAATARRARRDSNRVA